MEKWRIELSGGLKLKEKVGEGAFCQKLPINTSFRLPDHCSVFQAEVAAIKAVNILLRSLTSFRDLCIHSDIRAALLSLNSSVVKECLTFLSIDTSYFVIRLVRVPGYCGIVENCKAYKLVREGTRVRITSEWKCVGSSWSTCARALDLQTSHKLAKR